jgi:ketosteroid isomerase-like protein
MDSLREAWGSVQANPERFIEHGDRMVVLSRTVARGLTSGAPSDAPVGHVFTIREGQIARFQTFADRTDALRAVGLDP